MDYWLLPAIRRLLASYRSVRPSTESLGETTSMLPTAAPRAADDLSGHGDALVSTVTPKEDLPRVLGQRYTLVDPLGSGGMGTVWRSHDKLLRREVAIKEVIIPAGVPTRERELLYERMLREARAAAALNHPSVVSIFDVVNYNDRPWIVMELLEASSITDIIRDHGPMTPLRVAEVGLAVLGALATAHSAGVLHRDVKPGNVLITTAGRVVLTDFGAARCPNDTPLTSTGLLLGSPQYIAPERARGRPFGPASDLFSLGSSLYAAVEGRPPFDRGEP
ncbi:MAG: serine/threonine-protein kinase, partial [Mycobacteriales bacterium]